MRSIALACLLGISVLVGVLYVVAGDSRRATPALEPPIAAFEAPAATTVPASVDPPETRPLLTGTIVAIDELGEEHRLEDGRFLLQLVDPEGGRTFVGAEVRGGSWSIHLARRPTRDRLTVLRCTLGSRVAIGGPAQVLPVPLPAQGIELRVHWLADVVVHVRMRDEALELWGIFLRDEPRLLGEPAPYPPHLGLVVGRPVGSSPVRIQRFDDRWLGRHVLHARGPGTTWGELAIDDATGEIDVILEPAGQLELVIEDGYPRHEDEELSLFSAEPRPRLFLRAPLERTEAFLVESLPPGTYIAQARCEGQLVGAERAEVVAGVKTTVTLTTEPPSTELVPFEGTLTLPADWGLDEFQLDLVLGGAGCNPDIPGRAHVVIQRSEMTLAEGSRERFRWSAGLVPAGRYHASVRAASFDADVDTGLDGTSDARVDVPVPARVSVVTIDGRTGAVLDSGIVGIATRLLEHGHCWNSLGRSVQQPLVIPCGDTRLLVSGSGYEITQRDLTLEPGESELVWPLDPR